MMDGLFTTRDRNVLLVKICLGMATFESASALYVKGIAGIVIPIAAIIAFGIPLYGILARKLTNQTKYIITMAMLAFHFVMQSVMDDWASYCFTYLNAVLVFLYYNFRPLLLIGLGNIALTLYLYFTEGSAFFHSTNAGGIVPFVMIHAILTVALIAQAVRIEKMRLRSLSMEVLTRTDALTGLYNLRAFHEYMDQFLVRNPQNVQLAIVDIDDFKRINDTYGHMVGDIVLKRVAQTLSAQVDPEDMVARYGGEEFTITFLNKTLYESYRMSANIVEAVGSMRHPELDDAAVTVSIGLTSHDIHSDKRDLFLHADALLYKAKRNGKNRVSV